MASVFKRGRTFWIRYTLNGKQHRESLCTRSEKVAKMKLREYEVELDKGTLQSPSKTFLEIFLIEYFKHLKGIRPKKSWVNEKNRLECFFNSTGVTKLEQLTAATIAGHLERLAAKSPTGAWRPATYNRYREALVALFDYAIERFAFVSRDPKHPNPARGLRRRKVPKPEVVYLNDQEIVALLDVLEPHRQMQAMVVSYDGASTSNDASVYVDGVALSVTETAAPTGAIGVYAGTCNLGNRTAGSHDRPFDGLMDDVRIYNRVLSAAEIQALYDAAP